MRRRKATVRLGLIAVLVLLAVGIGTVVKAASPATSVVPAQFVAKLYTEALGRPPDKGGWNFWLGGFSTTGCSPATLADVTRSFYNSSEYLQSGYDNWARVLTLYRGTLNREPDQGGLDHYASSLSSGRSWPQVVNEFVGSAEFTSLANTICSSGSTASGYGYGSQPAPTLPVSGAGFAGGSGQQLQQVLNGTPAGGTVYLAQKAVVRVSAALEIPAGVTLATTGEPAPRSYAVQGRLVRDSIFDDPVVRLRSGARLRSVWVDGQLGDNRRHRNRAINVQTFGGTGTEVANNKIGNSAGWSNVQVLGSYENAPCASASIVGNLVTAYSGTHYPVKDQGGLVDGLSVGCENAVVRGNAIIDATDVGIVVFRAGPATQRSQVTENSIISAGNPAFGGLGVDSGWGQAVTQDFTGTVFRGNHLWTGPYSHFDIALAVGVRPWFGERVDPGTGVKFLDNTTDGMAVRAGTGVAVSIKKAVVQGNTLNFTLLTQGVVSCPHVSIGVDSDGFAEGSDVQPGGTPVSFMHPAGGGWGCIGMHQP